MTESWAGSPTSLEPPILLAHLERDQDAFAAVLAAGELSAPVPGCPGWDLAALGGHLGNAHRWARGAIVDGHPNTQDEPVPSGRDELTEWYQARAGALVEVLRAAGPDAPCWAFGPKPARVGFWFRRQAQETAVHLWDARQSQGQAGPIDAELALDGVDEVARMFFPRQVRLHRMPPLDRSLALVATTADGRTERWVLAGDGTGAAARPDAPAEATLSGPADRVLLALWQRVPIDAPELALTGDAAAARDVLARPITP